jgi:hypothetical protein
MSVQVGAHQSNASFHPILIRRPGDIITAVSIVQSIYEALSDNMGASYNYQCLITELRDFEQALS